MSDVKEQWGSRIGVIFALNLLVVYRGLSGGIEINGLGYMWNPKLAKLGEPETWLAAAGQILGKVLLFAPKD